MQRISHPLSTYVGQFRLAYFFSPITNGTTSRKPTKYYTIQNVGCYVVHLIKLSAPESNYAFKAFSNHLAAVVCGAANSLTSLLVVAAEHFPSHAVTGAYLMDRI